MKPGDTFGDYTVERLLGKGGMGEVWLLQDDEGREVAAKFLDAAASQDREARKRFLREAELAMGVKHPNLVEVYDIGQDPGTGLCYILMEYVPGGSLADYLKTNGALPIEDAVAVVRAIAGVLELGRTKGIVHRDIKPANIMFGADGTPKLADLGIARGGLAGEGGTETTTVTQTGTMIGTPAYMSPEQMLDAHHVDTRADIYSLGVVFFEMLTGERPNKDDTVIELMAKAVKGEPLPDVRTLRPEVSASLAQLINMMVVPDKEGRISTPGQITSALATIARGGELKGKAGTAVSVPTPRHAFPWKTLLPWAGGALALVAVALAAAALVLCLRRPADRNPVERPSVPVVADVTKDPQAALDRCFPGWKVEGTVRVHPGYSAWEVGLQKSWRGRADVVTTMPPREDAPCVLSRRVKLDMKNPVLVMEVASHSSGVDFMVTVKVNGETALAPYIVCTPDSEPYQRILVPLRKWRDRDVRIEVDHICNNWFLEYAFWSRLEIIDGTGKETCGPEGLVSRTVFPHASLTDDKWLGRVPWAYTEQQPAGNWTALAYDDSKWKRTRKALGRGEGPEMTIADSWQSDRIWLRRKFNWNGPMSVYKAIADIRFHRDAEMYLNGKMVMSMPGYTPSWWTYSVPYSLMTREFASALRQGENVLAVTVKGDGASFFDCGLVIETRNKNDGN